jgi:hypothetical protein
VRRALIGKVIGQDAGTDALIRAILWARDGGAHVISMQSDRYETWAGEERNAAVLLGLLGLAHARARPKIRARHRYCAR